MSILSSMDLLQTHNFDCPYCGEINQVEVDCSIPEQEYIEDCQVCCRPITILLSIDNNEVSLVAKNENE